MGDRRERRGCDMNRRDLAIAGALAAIMMALLAPSASMEVDFHHDGIMLKPALDVLSGQVLFRDTFMQYGALSTYLQVVALWIHPTLLSVRFLTVAAYGVSLFFLYAAWCLILPRSLAILSCGLLMTFFPLYEKNWLNHYWLLLPWSSVFAMMFQSIGLYALFRIIRGEQPVGWGAILGATCAGVFWCRQPVGIIMFGTLVAIGWALQISKWAPAHASKRSILSAIIAGLTGVTALCLGSILVSGAFPEWFYQNFIWPRNWALQTSREIPTTFVSIFLHPAAAAGLLLVLLALAAPWIVERFRPGLTTRVRVGWWLGVAAVMVWQHERVLSWLSLRDGGWTVLLPIVIGAQACHSLVGAFGRADPARTTEYYLVAALAAFALGSVGQYYPMPDTFHSLWALAPGFGLFVFVCWRSVGLPAAVVVLGLTAALLPSLITKVRAAREALARPLVTLERPAVLRGMKVEPSRARTLDGMVAALDEITLHRPNIPSVMVGGDAMFLCFTQNRENPSPYFVTWAGLVDEQEFQRRWSYISRVRPLLFFHKSRWDAVNEFYKRERYVPMLYLPDEVLEIAVPEELAKVMGRSVYGLDPKNLPAKPAPAR